MKTKIITGILFALGASLLAGCGGKEAQSGGNIPQQNVEGGGPALEKTFYDASVTSFDGTEIAFTVFQPELPEDTSAPLLIHGHGWGVSRIKTFEPDPVSAVIQSDVTGKAAEMAWNDGYFVISFDQRGWGESQGNANIMDPEVEGRDVQAIVDWAVANFSPHLAHVAGDPLLGGVGVSYGGGFQTIGSSVDDRWDVIIPSITWNDLRYSLNPNGVPKSTWAAILTGASALAGFTVEPFLYETVVEGLLSNALNEDQQTLLYERSLASFCDGMRADGRVAPQVDAFFVQGLHDILFNANESYANVSCLEAAGRDARLLWLRDGHIVPLTQEAGNQLIVGVQYEAQCGTQRFDVAQMMLDFLNEKLRGIEPAQAIPKVCITQSEEEGIVLDEVPLGGDSFTAADQQVVTGLAPELVLGLLLDLDASALANILGQLPENTATLITAALAGLQAPGEDLAAAVQAVLNVLPYQLLNELTTYEHFADLLSVEERTVVAGIPRATLNVAATLEQDVILFAGLGVRRSDGRTELLHEQVTPIKGAGVHELDLVGISTVLQPGETVGLIVMPFSPQFFSAFSRVPEPVTVGGSVSLPLIEE